MRYRFDRFELDTLQFALRLGASDIHIEPLVFDLLRFLVERAGQVVTRDIIVEHVWHGRFVSDATISSCIKSARKALGDDGRSQVYIRTIRGRGLQFVRLLIRMPWCRPTSRHAITPRPNLQRKRRRLRWHRPRSIGRCLRRGSPLRPGSPCYRCLLCHKTRRWL